VVEIGVFETTETMTTKLNSPLKRELEVEGDVYTLTISPGGLKLVPKGRRKGQELAWRDFVSGDAALAAGLNASLGQYHQATKKSPPPSRIQVPEQRRARKALPEATRKTRRATRQET
jgi:hypothetical protein